MTIEPIYVIWSHEHGAWWRPNSAGYTRNATEAGLYSRAEAMRICRDATRDWSQAPNEVPVLAADLYELKDNGSNPVS